MRPGWGWQRIRNQIVDGQVCSICGVRPAVTADHVVRRRDGGGDERSNLRPACERCNAERG
jgi:5-methylcytosine-specific restriction protein A